MANVSGGRGWAGTSFGCSSDARKVNRVGSNRWPHLSCPTVSPEPSSLLQPDFAERSWPSQSLSSLADMLTMSLNSLKTLVSFVCVGTTGLGSGHTR